MGLCPELSKQALLFVNKKKQKNFDSLRALSTPREAEQKFFGYFFSKK
jgi:hypothetical protein